jgi:hypothetical protein
MKIRQNKRIVLILIASAMVCSGVLAAPVWLCSLTSAVAVDEDGTVGAPDLGGLERPTFLRVDVDKKEVALLAPESRRGEVTAIEISREQSGLWLLAGVEHDRGWTMIITATGNMTMTISADGVVWSVFGHALLVDEDVRDMLKPTDISKKSETKTEKEME